MNYKEKFYTTHIFENIFVCQTQEKFLHAYFIKGEINKFAEIITPIVERQDLLP